MTREVLVNSVMKWKLTLQTGNQICQANAPTVITVYAHSVRCLQCSEGNDFVIRVYSVCFTKQYPIWSLSIDPLAQAENHYHLS